MEEKMNLIMNMSLASLARQKVMLNLICHLMANGDPEMAKQIHSEACDVIDAEEKNIVEVFGYRK